MKLRFPQVNSRNLTTEVHGFYILQANTGKTALTFLTIIATAVGCRPVIERSQTAYVIDVNDILKLDTQSNGKEFPLGVVNAAVLISTTLDSGKIKFCSGSVAKHPQTSDVIVLSNHHCFANSDSEGKVEKEILKESCTKTEVFFGFRAGETKNAEIRGCKKGSLLTDHAADLSVFQLTSDPPDNVRPLELADEDFAAEKTAAFIIHYPDVPKNAERPPGASSVLPTAALTKESCATIGRFPRSEWSLDPSLPYAISHSCDLIHGSSGSALLAAADHRILGVNWGGLRVQYPGETKVVNVATSAGYIRAFLAKKVDDFKKIAESVPDSADATPAKSKKEKLAKKLKDGSSGCGAVGVGGFPSGPIGALLMSLFGVVACILRRPL